MSDRLSAVTNAQLRNPGVAINNHANFENFGQAMLVLVRMCTGEVTIPMTL